MIDKLKTFFLIAGVVLIFLGILGYIIHAGTVTNETWIPVSLYTKAFLIFGVISLSGLFLSS